MPDEPIDRDLAQMAGDANLGKAVKEQIVRLSKGAGGPDLAEMARDLLEGRTDLRTLATSSAYAEQLTAGTAEFQRWYCELTPDEREKLIADTDTRVSSMEPDA